MPPGTVASEVAVATVTAMAVAQFGFTVDMNLPGPIG